MAMVVSLPVQKNHFIQEKNKPLDVCEGSSIFAFVYPHKWKPDSARTLSSNACQEQLLALLMLSFAVLTSVILER